MSDRLLELRIALQNADAEYEEAAQEHRTLTETYLPVRQVRSGVQMELTAPTQTEFEAFYAAQIREQEALEERNAAQYAYIAERQHRR